MPEQETGHNTEWKPSKRMEDLAKRIGMQIPVTESVGKEKSFVLKEKSEELHETARDIDFVLAKVPHELRGSTENFLKYQNDLDEAKERLKKEGIDLDVFIKKGNTSDPEENLSILGQKKATMRGIVEKIRGGIELDKKEQEIVDQVNIKKEDVVDVVEQPKEQPPIIETPARREPEKSEKKIRTKKDVEDEVVRLSQLTEPGLRSRAYLDLATLALKIDEVPMDLINQIADMAQKSKLETYKKSNEASEIRELDTDAKRIKWGRERLALYLSPDSEQTLRLMGGVFHVQIETIYGKRWEDGLPYMPETVQSQMKAEFTTAQELRTTFNNWKTNHEKIDNLVNEKSFVAFSNEEVGRILNSLNGENGVPGEGSKNVARAIALYAKMAVTAIGKTSNLEFEASGNGLDEAVPSIFNTVLSAERITQIRKKIADKCGGDYYESLALMLAKMMGVAAKGSDSLKSGIENSDCVGKLMFTRQWNFEGETTDRWLPLEMAMDEKGGLLFLRRNEISDDYRNNGTNYQIQLAVDAFGLQFKGEPGKKNYCLVRVGEKYRVISTKELSDGEVDSGKNMTELLLNGQLDSVDWKGSSFEFLNGIKKRNEKSFDIYNMLRETLDAKGTLDLNVMEKKKELIDSALGHYGEKTKYWVGYLYTESWLRRHSLDWLKKRYGNKSEEAQSMVWTPDKMKSFIQKAKMAGLIDDALAEILKGHYKT